MHFWVEVNKSLIRIVFFQLLIVNHKGKNFLIERILIYIKVDVESRSVKRAALFGFLANVTVAQ